MSRSRLGLGGKLGVILGGLLLMLGLVTAVMVSWELRSVMHGEFVSKGEGVVKSLARGVEEMIVADNRSGIQALITQFESISGIRYLAILDQEGNVSNHNITPSFPESLRSAILPSAEQLASMQVADADQTLVTTFVKEVVLPDGGHALDIQHPLLLGTLGTAHVGMNLEVIEDRVRSLTVKVSMIFLVFIVIGELLGLTLARQIVRPLYKMVELLLAVSVRLANASNEILAASQEQEGGIAEQSTTLEEIAHTMDGLAATARAISQNADGLSQLSEQVFGSAHSGHDAVGTTRTSMAKIVEHNDIVVDRIAKLYEQSQSIISVIDIIDNISDRLDLLALNAALEGSRAGEVGRGFSLVAQEMRRLAENVTGSTKEIKETIREIHRYTQACIDAIQQSKAATVAGAGETDKMAGAVQTIFDLVSKATEGTRQINVITQQQLSSSQQMVTATKEVVAVSNETRVAAQQVTRSAAELTELSVNLRTQVDSLVGYFRLDGSDSSQALWTRLRRGRFGGRVDQTTVG